MIDALIAGKLFAKPVQRTGNSGKPFVTCKVRIAVGEESIFVSVIAFDGAVIKGLLALDAGDSVSLSGALTPKVWQGKPALDLVAQGLLTAYAVIRRRWRFPLQPRARQAVMQGLELKGPGLRRLSEE